jgi:hypothetical protein
MSILIVLSVSAALGLAPAAFDRLATRISPRLAARLGVAALTLSAAVMTATMLLLAAPPILRLLELDVLAGVCDRLLFHLGVGLPPTIGWVGPAGLAWIGMRIAWSSVGAGRFERRMRDALAGARPVALGVPFPVLMVDLDRKTAFSVGGRDGVIVMSRCLADALDAGEMAMVLHHEAAHLRNRHGRMLRRIAALEAAFGHLPGFKRAARSTRLAIERWADEAAIEEAGCDRVVATRALLKATSVAPSATPSLSNVDSIMRRLTALANPPIGSRAWPGVLAGAGLLATGLFGVLGFYTWVSHGHAALALAGWCPT